jgi:hypothetical protein
MHEVGKLSKKTTDGSDVQAIVKVVLPGTNLNREINMPPVVIIELLSKME